jgi:PAS domain S-box-containing protein
MNTTQTNVLLVEDDPATRRLIQRILSRAAPDFNCTLETAPTLSNAISHLRKTRFDNILLDLNLPDSRGLETVDRIHNSSPKVPITVLTAINDTEIEVEAIKRGADECLRKGIDVWESLAGHIRYAIQRKKAIEALRNTCDYFKSVVENAPSAIVCISSEGRILDFNAEAQRLWSCAREEVMGKSFLETCIPHGDRFNLYIDLRRVLVGQSVRSTKTTLALPDGSRHSLSWDFSCMGNGDGRSPVVVAVAHDITTNLLSINNRPSALKLTFNPDFNDTVDIVINSLTAILEKIEEINKCADADSLKRLADEMCRSDPGRGQITSHNAAAIRRLVLSLIAPDPNR